MAVQIDIRPVSTARDFAETVPLLLELNGGGNNDGMDADDMCRAFLLSLDHDYEHFSVYQNDELIGTFGLSLRYNPTFFAPGCEISNFIVTEKWRSKKIGSQILKFIERYARDRGAGFARLFVYPSNMHAVRFYENHGFAHTSNYMYLNYNQTK